jgi:hypothetical protein
MFHIPVPMFGTKGARVINVGRALHRVPDEIAFAMLRKDLDYICEGAPWVAAVARANGDIMFVPSRPGLIWPRQDQIEKMVAIAKVANIECGHGGHWVLAFADGHLHALWRDADGDMLFANTFPDTWDRRAAIHAVAWTEVLDACWQSATDHVKEMGIKPGHTIKRAQGERSQTSH